MRSRNAIFGLVVLVLGTLVATSAFADRRYYRNHHHHSGVRLGVFVGPGFFYGPPYPYPYYHYPRVVVAPPPVHYIERTPEHAGSSLPAGYWYYCNEAKSYYPYVKECPSSWQQVAPQPPQ